MVLRRTLLTLTAAAALAACGAPAAHAEGSLVDVQIVDRSYGDTLPQYRHRGQAWVAGRPGERYAVRLTNRSGARVRNEPKRSHRNRRENLRHASPMRFLFEWPRSWGAKRTHRELRRLFPEIRHRHRLAAGADRFL